jgi:hypothetical protein
MPGPAPKHPSQLSPEAEKHGKTSLQERIAKLEMSRPVGHLGQAPKWMTTEEKKIWRTLAKTAPAVLGENDRTLMEIVVTLKAKLEKHTITTPELSQLISCLNKLGFIPLDRPVVEKEKAADPLDRFNS